ncbi:hypothetical protein E4U53_000864, partial [Claviceps sorghi]
MSYVSWGQAWYGGRGVDEMVQENAPDGERDVDGGMSEWGWPCGGLAREERDWLHSGH